MGQDHHSYGTGPPQLWDRTITAMGQDHHSYGTGPPQLWDRTITAMGQDHHSYGTGPPQLWDRTTTAMGQDHHSYGTGPPQLWNKPTGPDNTNQVLRNILMWFSICVTHLSSGPTVLPCTLASLSSCTRKYLREIKW